MIGKKIVTNLKISQIFTPIKNQFEQIWNWKLLVVFDYFAIQIDRKKPELCKWVEFIISAGLLTWMSLGSCHVCINCRLLRRLRYTFLYLAFLTLLCTEGLLCDNIQPYLAPPGHKYFFFRWKIKAVKICFPYLETPCKASFAKIALTSIYTYLSKNLK